MTAFDALNVQAVRSVQRVRGETFTVSPRTEVSRDVNARRAADPARSPVTLIAVLHEYFSRPDGSAGGATARAPTALSSANMAQPAGHTSQRVRIKFRLADLLYGLEKGDRVIRIATGHVYNVAEIRRGSFGNLTADLNLIERP